MAVCLLSGNGRSSACSKEYAIAGAGVTRAAELEELVELFEPPSADDAPLPFHVADDVDAWIDRNRAALT